MTPVHEEEKNQCFLFKKWLISHFFHDRLDRFPSTNQDESVGTVSGRSLRTHEFLHTVGH